MDEHEDETEELASQSTNSTISTKEIQEVIERMRNNQHRGSTKKNYHSIWKTFNQFILKLDHKPRNWEQRIILFVGYLIQQKHQSSTIRSYVSAIEAVLNYGNIKIREDVYLLSSLTKACWLVNDRVKTSLPIHKGILHLILIELKRMYQDQPYLRIMYNALFVTTYF